MSRPECGEDALWACTRPACMSNCPVFIETRSQDRQNAPHLTENQAKFPRNCATSTNPSSTSNPWESFPGRTKWAKGLEIPCGADDSVEYLFYVAAPVLSTAGTGRRDALVQALRAAGISFGIWHGRECCGDSCRLATSSSSRSWPGKRGGLQEYR